MSNYLTDGTTTIELHHVLWTNRGQSSGVPGCESKTLGGVTVVQRFGVSSAPEIILEAALDGENLKGWWYWSDLLQFETWRDGGTELTFVYDDVSYGVVIPRDGIGISLLWPRMNPQSTARCIGTLRLI